MNAICKQKMLALHNTLFPTFIFQQSSSTSVYVWESAKCEECLLNIPKLNYQTQIETRVELLRWAQMRACNTHSMQFIFHTLLYSFLVFENDVAVSSAAHGRITNTCIFSSTQLKFKFAKKKTATTTASLQIVQQIFGRKSYHAC